MRAIHCLALALSLTAAASAQCPKPQIPPQGLATTVLRDQPLTYSDGYRILYHLTYPQGTPPACGWPLVVFVHGYGGQRSVQAGLAKWGYAVAAQDVRGQGAAKTLNPSTMGMSFYGADEKFDLAELIHHVRKTHPLIVAKDKVAVTGGSQGGIHSYFAAAYSGRSMTTSTRGTIVFPKIDCVVPQNFSPDAMQHALRDDTLVSLDVLNKVLNGGGSAVMETGFVQKFTSYWLSQDIAGLARALHQEPYRDVAGLLPQTAVPIQCAHAWLDAVQSPHELVEVMQSLPATLPAQALLSTIGHQSPGNDYELRWRDRQRRRWFDRYLWNVPNGVDGEARYQMAALPTSAAVRADAKSLWQRRFDASYPAADLVPERRYLDAARSLTGSEPTSLASAKLKHVVSPSFTASHMASSIANRNTAAILRAIPLSEQLFSTETFTAERELGGSARVSLSVVPNAERFTIAALLRAHVPGESNPVLLAHWARGVLGAQPNIPMRLEFDLSPSVAVLPKGSRLELILRNHWLREAPFLRDIVTAPYLTSSETELRMGAKALASYVDLPFRARVRPGLVAPTNELNARLPADLPMELHAGAASAGQLQVTLASLSGQHPGIPLPGGPLPLHWDAMSEFGLLLANGPAFVRFVSVLDASGKTQPVLRLRPLGLSQASLQGLRLSFASWVFDRPGSLRGQPSNPIDVYLR